MDTTGVVSAYLMPHPPILVPSVGKGREGLANRTIQACHLAADSIRQAQPDSLVVISPHAPLYRDYSFAYPPSVTQGSFQRFGAADSIITARSDQALRREVVTQLSARDSLAEASIHLPSWTMAYSCRFVFYPIFCPR
jgi:aromatic ring-opening dioxygenase LigB subunit